MAAKEGMGKGGFPATKLRISMKKYTFYIIWSKNHCFHTILNKKYNFLHSKCEKSYVHQVVLFKKKWVTLSKKNKNKNITSNNVTHYQFAVWLYDKCRDSVKSTVGNPAKVNNPVLLSMHSSPAQRANYTTNYSA